MVCPDWDQMRRCGFVSVHLVKVAPCFVTFALYQNPVSLAAPISYSLVHSAFSRVR